MTDTVDLDSTVDHPAHYRQHPSGVECIQITEHMGFNLGNSVKYIWRADEKGNAMEDLAKARWYIDREIKRREYLSNQEDTEPISFLDDLIGLLQERVDEPEGCACPYCPDSSHTHAHFDEGDEAELHLGEFLPDINITIARATQP